MRVPTSFDERRVARDLRAHLADLETVELADLEKVRAGTVPDALSFDPSVQIRSVLVPGPRGAPEVRLVLYDGRKGGEVTGAVLHAHGGAFVSGAPEFDHRRCLSLASGAGCLVASVDYRLAPEHRYPAGLDDCSAALDWVVANAEALGVDPAGVGVAGGSAGGCLAAALALRGRDGLGQPVAFALLVYPATDSTCSTRSMRTFERTPGFCGRNAAQMWSLYLPSGIAPDAYASPALAGDLAGLPPTYVGVAELDPLRDEGIEYATRLIAAEVPVELRVFRGVWHGFDLAAPESGSAREFLGSELAALRGFLGLDRVVGA